MPIRHCQKCGLKVLIDESQTTLNPFFCQRCNAALKTDEKKAEAEAATSTTSSVGGKPASIRVACPYCKASFNGRVPQKPAKGSCPICQKELILLPNGDIRAFAGFDLAKWQAEKGGTKSRPKPAEAVLPELPAEPAAADPGIPEWMDEDLGRGGTADTAPPDPEPVPEPAPEPEPEPAPMPEPPAADALASMPTPPPGTLPAAVEAPPPAEELPPAAPATGRAGLARRLETKRRERTLAAIPTAPATGAGKIFFSFLLAALPVAAAPVALNLREKFKEPLETIGTRLAKGFMKIDDLIFSKAPPPPPPEEKKPEPPPPPEEKKPDAAQQGKDEQEINDLWMKYMRKKRTVDQLAVGANDEQKAKIEKEREELNVELERINIMRENYKKNFGKDYDPKEQ